VTVLRAFSLLYLLTIVGVLGGLSDRMSAICSVAVLCGYLDWVGRGRPRFALRGQAR
jgi:hypothetical protein